MHCVLSFKKRKKKWIFMSERAGLDTSSGVDLQGGGYYGRNKVLQKRALM